MRPSQNTEDNTHEFAETVHVIPFAALVRIEQIVQLMGGVNQ